MNPTPRLFRSDSLYSRLQTNEAREQVFAWTAVDCLGPEATAKKIAEAFGVETSAAAVHEMVKRCGLSWRLQRSVEISKEQEKQLPDNIDAAERIRLRQVFRDAAFENLSFSEMLAMREYKLAEDALELKRAQHEANVKFTQAQLKQKEKALAQKDKALKQADRRVKLLEEKGAEVRARLKALTNKKTGSKGLSPETLRKIEEAANLL